MPTRILEYQGSRKDDGRQAGTAKTTSQEALSFERIDKGLYFAWTKGC